ncbi:unnamed protein product [Thelazia callipaeda]|uniref:Transposase n=1 Tax=Thelazia callipaeda TaxID=103827 RepID=A0A0N5CXL5_THECL|nr:unnamed protein product [Thelazia callipaeda]
MSVLKSGKYGTSKVTSKYLEFKKSLMRFVQQKNHKAENPYVFDFSKKQCFDSKVSVWLSPCECLWREKSLNQLDFLQNSGQMFFCHVDPL